MSAEHETSIVPWLSVRRGREAVAFYREAFGAELLHEHANEAGEIVARLAVAGAEFWVADDDACSPETLGAGSVRMILSVADPDAVFARALAAGATAVAEVYEGHGWRIGRIADPAGHHWEVGRPLG